MTFLAWLTCYLTWLTIQYARWTVLSLLWAYRLAKHHEWPDYYRRRRDRRGRFIVDPLRDLERALR